MSKEYSLIIEHFARKSLKNLQTKFIKQIVFKIFTLQDNPFRLSSKSVLIHLSSSSLCSSSSHTTQGF